MSTQEHKKAPAGKGFWLELIYWLLVLLYWESLLHTAVFGGFQASFGYAMGFSVAIALVLAGALSFVPKKAITWASLGVSALLMIFYGSQMVYQFIFGTLYSTALMEQGGQAMTSFWRETLAAMGEHWFWLVLLVLPLGQAVLLRQRIWNVEPRTHWRWRALTLAAALLVSFETELIMKANGTELFSDYDYYTNGAIATNPVAERFGLLTTFRLELFGSEAEAGAEEEDPFFVPEEPEEEPEPQVQETEPVEKPVQYNVMNIDFDALNEMTDEKKIKAINNYCAQLTGTKQNEYTGMLADYNLIVLCGESFSTGAIHPEVTPTLYKLASEGIIFNNYYNSFPNTTTDGEYALMQGLFPDTSRHKSASSLYASRNSYLPFTLGNLFREQRGIESRGYHNYEGSYYGRDDSHPNMGYTMKFAGAGMEFTNAWPASDLEMMEQSVDDYLTGGQFHAYYMTFSGHYRYQTSSNAIAKQNWDQVKDLPYTDKATKAYLSCNIELDRALAYLMQRLEEAGVADKTAIVLAGDHFPYGLTDAQYSELVGYDIDRFSKYKSTLIFWVGGLEENIIVDEYCCNVDILPTILNLWGLEYDSRLLAGTDVFSDSEHVAVLIDKSWLTELVWFDANKGKPKYLVDESEIPEGYVDNMNALISNRFKISSHILNTAYYNFVFGKDAVTVNKRVWN